MVSKKTLKKKLDTLVAKTTKKVGRCLNPDCGKTQNLQWCHLVTRRILRTRWLPENSTCLCAGCHIYGHQHPSWLTVLWDKIKGIGIAEKVEAISREVEPFKIQDMLQWFKFWSEKEE